MLHGRVKIKICPVFEPCIHILQHNVIDIGSQMSYGCIQKLQTVLQTKFFEFRSGC